MPSILALFLLASLSAATAQAATATNTPGGICTKVGAITVIGGKTLICTKVLSGKLVWSTSATPPAIGGTKPQISGGGREGGSEGPGNPGDDHGFGDGARQARLAKYNACLVAHGGTPRSVSAAQSKAKTACASLAPKFKFRGDD